jgi:hypothetical protein
MAMAGMATSALNRRRTRTALARTRFLETGSPKDVTSHGNMLHERDITFFYKKPLLASDGTMYLPDFTLIWQGKEIYWEHVGRLGDPVYAAKWAEKLEWYEKNFPGRLRVTYELNPGLAPWRA